jgi:hypothetical protein
VTAALPVRGNAAESASFARCDCGLLVGFPSVLSAPPSSAPIATTPTTTRPTHAAIVRHGCRALIITVCVESFIPRATLAPKGAVRIGPRALLALRPLEERIVVGLDRLPRSCKARAEKGDDA